MTASDFIPTGEEQAGPSYPKLFGLTLTPTVSGILIALVGVGGAVWLFLNLVQPALQENQQLKQSIADKQSQLVNQQAAQRQIAEARAKLQDAQQLQKDVLGLFATDQSLDTLLLDVNERVQSVNAGIQDPNRRAVLAKFDLNPEASGPVNDGSLGAAVNGKLKRQVYDVEIQGTFPQTQSIIRNIERLEPLLVVNNFKSELDSSTQVIVLDSRGRLVPAGQPETRTKTTFRLDALVPINGNTPPPSPGAQGAAPPKP